MIELKMESSAWDNNDKQHESVALSWVKTEKVGAGPDRANNLTHIYRELKIYICDKEEFIKSGPNRFHAVK